MILETLNTLALHMKRARQALIEGIQYAMQEFHAIQAILINIETYLQGKGLIHRGAT